MSKPTLPIIILVEPQLGENIGSVARAMKNFDFNELRIVNPRDGWPNKYAIQMAANGEEIIHNAKIFPNLSEAIDDLNYLYATAAKKRSMIKRSLLSSEINTKFNFNVKSGIMFGRESSGLTNEEISLANQIINISTKNFLSLNLAQAALIICYELSNKFNQLQEIFVKEQIIVNKKQKIISKNELNIFLNYLVTELKNKNFFRIPEKQSQFEIHIMNIFSRIDNINKSELQILYGIVKTLISTETK